MRNTGIFDPRFINSASTVGTALASLARCAIFRSDGTRPEWAAGIGNTTNGTTQLWLGFCRVQPLIDMRAHERDFSGEYDASTAVRINLPFGRNEFGAVLNADNTIKTYAPDPTFNFGDYVDVISSRNPGQNNMMTKRFVVRNDMTSSTAFQFDLLCDIGTSSHG